MPDDPWIDRTIVADSVDDPPAMQGRIVRMRGQNFLFSAPRRAIYSLNDTAADIWLSLQEGVPPASIAAAMAGGGVDPQEARHQVEATIEHWEKVGLIVPHPPPAARFSPDCRSQVVALPGLRIRVVYPRLEAGAAEVFRHLEAAGKEADILLELVARGSRVHLFQDREWVLSCSHDELPTLLKGQMLAAVLDRGGYELAFHAASLARHDRALLLCGSAGAGKTTLTLALLRAGFAFAGDDVTLLDPDGRSLGLPFAPAVKAGAWPILAEAFPEMDAGPVYRRPDRKRVRYPVPARLAPMSPRPVGWVVILRRRRTSSAALEPVDPAGAFEGLIEGAFARSGQLSDRAFDLLAEVIRTADIYRLTYSRLEDAVELIGDACK